MANDITGFGVVVTLIATATFPVGFPITQFADDSDPLDFASVKIGDVAMGLNGDLINWAKAAPLPMVLNVIPGGIDDINLGILADANRVSQGKVSSFDDIKAVVVYADGRVITLTGGKMTDAMFGNSIASAGRLKTKTYAFMFEAKNGA